MSILTDINTEHNRKSFTVEHLFILIKLSIKQKKIFEIQKNMSEPKKKKKVKLRKKITESRKKGNFESFWRWRLSASIQIRFIQIILFLFKNVNFICKSPIFMQ